MKRLLAALLFIVLAGHAQAQALSAPDVNLILSRAVQEAQARGTNATIAVVDRIGNVLAVHRIGGAVNVTITSGRGIAAGNGLEQVSLDSTFAAIAKAITGAYLSSSGNAFTTRTASQIVQEHFNVGETNQAAGPLFGVQFSQLPCSDLMSGGDVVGGIGPRRSPLGLSADPGGMPLYINGQVVGGIGVIADGIYGLDRDISNYDRDLDELIALAGQSGFAPPEEIKAYRIAVDGRLLRYADVDERDLLSNPGAAPAGPAAGTLVTVAGYFTAGGGVRAGVTYGSAASGIQSDASATAPQFPGLPAATFVLTDGAGTNRYPPTNSTAASLAAGDRMTAAEVQRILQAALLVAFQARAQIRRPLGSFAEVTVSVIDVEAAILGIARTRDAPIFGTDVSLQKARSAAFFSRTTAFAELNAAGGTVPNYATAARAFIGGNALADGTAYSARGLGNLARPFYPDGITSNGNGPYSLPFTRWSPLNVGLQLDLIQNDIVARLDGSLIGAQGCVNGAGGGPTLPNNGAGGPTRLANGMQIFAGGVPIYRNGVLVGAIGVSGDGIDQDDMIAFLGLANGASNGLGNAPDGIRLERQVIRGVAPRYVSCPVKPFNYSHVQLPCRGR
ncbi:heme-binding protein [Ferrovibrio sp.]|uniref:heme-binding protein n=1 Tax=Ferrovibrio sp. TaxID=1917215 RepID=UPI001B49778A|nr:heme-binding protein [Ferrovibrio sp.]MBP7064752.1 heme-binding protein [Ferrovibrio sp.]